MHPKTLIVALLASGIHAAPKPESSLELDPIAASIAKGVVLREDIPEGVEIFEFNGADEALVMEQAEGSSLNPSAILKRSDCNGSGLCGTGTSGAQCLRALSGYSDNSAYCGYTSRVSEHCTAIYTCSNYNGQCMYGWWLKEQFRKIYTHVGCGICGSYTIPNGAVIGCRATFNYCGTCQNIG